MTLFSHVQVFWMAQVKHVYKEVIMKLVLKHFIWTILIILISAAGVLTFDDGKVEAGGSLIKTGG